ncbi:MAG TPA: PLP-dependent aminotransferase family protein, partial [Vicinamibacterales bacterium]|nr:PLP-dependent aminotransferase family protein [Vicinamibacterales bacterium]
ESGIRKIAAVGQKVADLVPLAAGFPSPETFMWDAFRDITASQLSGADPAALQYGQTKGYAPLISALVEVMAARGVKTRESELLVTTGSQQGLDLVARVLVDPGDVVLVELPSYTGAISAFRNAGAAMVGVRQEADGIDLGDLDRILHQERAAGRRVRLLYVVPNFQNPTGLLISAAKRRRLVEWAAREDVLIVEDDPYGALFFDDLSTEADTRPIKADDTHGRVVYLSSFSKTLAPGFRVAWIAAPDLLTSHFEVAKQAIDICAGALDQRVVFQALKQGLLAAHLPGLRQHYQRKRVAMEETLRAELGGLVTWQTPRGGFFIWAELPAPIDTDRFIERAVKHGVAYVTGSAFFVEGAGSGRWARLSFSFPPADRIREGVRRLAGAVREELAQGAAATAGAARA